MTEVKEHTPTTTTWCNNDGWFNVVEAAVNNCRRLISREGLMVHNLHEAQRAMTRGIGALTELHASNGGTPGLLLTTPTCLGDLEHDRFVLYMNELLEYSRIVGQYVLAWMYEDLGLTTIDELLN